MTDEQKTWAESHIGSEINVTDNYRGVIVDYKADTTGLGVYWIVQNDPKRKARRKVPEYEEVYRYYPKEMTNKVRIHKP